MGRSDDYIFELLDTLGPQVHRLLVRITHSEDAAEDLLQDLFVKLLTKPDLSVENARAYLRQAAIHSALDWRRRRKVRHHQPLPDLSIPDDVGRAGIVREEAEVVLDALAALSETQREIVVLRYFEGESFDRIGELYNKSAHQIRSIHHKAMTRLRATLKRDSGST